MFRRRRRKANSLDYIRLPKVNLDPDMKRGIFIILILAFGAISLLSLFGLAEGLGSYLEKGIIFLFGWGKWLFPLLLLTTGFLMYNRDKDWVRGANFLGLFIFVIFFSALLHTFVGQNNWTAAVMQGAGGGYIGYGLLTIFYKIMGFWAGLIVIVCLIFISLMLMFNATLESIIGRDSWFAKMLYPINYIFNKIFGQGADEAETEAEFQEPESGEEVSEVEGEEVGAGEAGFYKHKIKAEADEGAEDAKEAKVEAKRNLWEPTNIKIDLPFSLLSSKISKPTSGDIKNNMIIIQRTLENFGIPVEMGEINIGPTVTQYTFKPAEGIKLTRITTLSNDLALSLAAHPIRIEAPIPGRSLVGVEVPNQSKAIVGLREILSDAKYAKRKNNMSMALGKDVSGNAWVDDITAMPHLLVAGATNSGKSVCLNTIIVSLLYQNGPDDLRFIMVDPKRVELFNYNGLPHLITPVITDVGKTVNALKWCINEMERRLELFEETVMKNIVDYNKRYKQKLPYIVFIIDELADLMVMAGRDVEASIIRLAQKARAVGIHLILATQDPRAEVVTGLIKANMPGRIAFAVASGINSRIILDSLGAEKLLGRGDMLFKGPSMSQPRRLQGAFVSDNEIKRIISFIKEKCGRQTFYLDSIAEKQKVAGLSNSSALNSYEDDGDDALGEAKEIIINSGKASASYLQRRLSIGYARAARLLDLLEKEGVIGPGSGSKPREVLISKEQYDSIINQGTAGVALHKREEAQAPEEYLPEEETEEAEEDPSTSSGQAEAEAEETGDKAGAETKSESEEIEAEDKATEDEVVEVDKTVEEVPKNSGKTRTKTVSLPDEDEPTAIAPAEDESSFAKASEDEDDGKYFSR